MVEAPTLCPPELPNIGEGGAQDALNVDAAMLIEVLVFSREKGVNYVDRELR